MINHGRARSTVKPNNIRVDEFHVWVHSNIVPISEPGTDGEESGGFEGFEFNMVQYTKDEWIQFVSETLFDVADTVDTTQPAQVLTVDAAVITPGRLKMAMTDPKTNVGKAMETRIQTLEAKFSGLDGAE